MKNKLLIYGANGYSGELMCRAAAQRNLDVVIAARSDTRLRPLADELGIEYRVFALEDAVGALDDIAVVLNCAGPFSATARPLVEACLALGIHYVDIAGELSVFQMCHELDARAKAASILLCPGAGFDIVPTDCLAASLKARMPDAQRIDLAFSFGTRPSAGSVKTLVEGIRLGGLIRRDHQLKKVSNGYRIRRVPFKDRARWSVTIPWADVYTAGVSTGVPNGMVYTALPLGVGIFLRLTSAINGLLATPTAQRWLKHLIDRFYTGGPSHAELDNHRTQFWGEAVDTDGRKLTAVLSAPSVYRLTVEAGLAIAVHCLKGTVAGFHTPAMLMGNEFIQSLPGVEWEH
ncbi:saccharopine dehydrogenase family protein [Pseudomonas serbica]